MSFLMKLLGRLFPRMRIIIAHCPVPSAKTVGLHPLIFLPLPLTGCSTMRSVALCSAYPAYKLKAADLTIARLSELTVYNMRRLFAAQVK